MAREEDFRMHRDQGYVFELAGRLGVQAEIVRHEFQTRSCREKMELLQETHGDWSLDRVVKAVYFHTDAMEPGHFLGVVSPEVERDVDFQGLLCQYFSGRQELAGSYAPRFAPKGMSFGTCTPFPYSFLVGDKGRDGYIDAIMVTDHPHLDNKVVDISVGGNSPGARKTSMHIPYAGIYSILRERFGSAVLKVDPKYS